MHQIAVTLPNGEKVTYLVRKADKREYDLIFKRIASQKAKISTQKGNLTSRLGRSPQSFLATGTLNSTMLREGSVQRDATEVAVNQNSINF